MFDTASYFSDRCLYTLLDNGIHLVVLKQASRQALKECFEHVEHIYRTASPESTLRLLVDLRAANLPPLLYVTRHVLRLRRLVPKQQPRKIAFIYAPDTPHSLLHRAISILTTPHRSKVRFLPATQWEQAVDWLLGTSQK